nr:immunoglobulin light chain junction region [Macaca mulatta]
DYYCQVYDTSARMFF